MTTTDRIFRLLKKSGRISGEAIGSELAVSRAAVYKHIVKIINAGAQVDSSTKTGYRLIDGGYNEYALRYELDERGWRPEVFFSPADSSNSMAKKYALTGGGEAVFAAPYQTAGRGRMARNFISAPGGAYFTLLLRPDGLDFSSAMLAVIRAGLAVRDTLAECGVESGLKWPNDVYAGGKKICGILPELITSLDRPEAVIIGAGINVSNILSAEIKEIAVSVKELTGRSTPLAEFTAAAAVRIRERVRLKDGSRDIAEYRKACITIGRDVTVTGGALNVAGKAAGVTDEGFLILDTNNGRITITSGDVSL